MMTYREAYIFGWVYGTIDTEVYRKTNRNLNIASPQLRPLNACTLAIQRLQTLKLLSPEIDQTIMEAYSQISYVDDKEQVISLELQGGWQLGYYQARAGKPLDIPDKLDIAGLRRKLKLTQAQLAEKVGVTQGQVSNWERDNDQPSEENMRKLREVLTGESVVTSVPDESDVTWDMTT